MKTGILVNLSETVSQRFSQAREQGFSSCQLVSWQPDAWTDKTAAAVKAAMEKNGMEITAFWCGYRGPKIWNLKEGQESLGFISPAYRFARMEDLMSGADFAKKLGVRDVATHAGFLPENPLDPNFRPVVIALAEICRHLKENGQRFLFETGQETPVTLLRVIEELGEMGLDNAGVNLDPANLILYGKGNPVDALDVFGKYVWGVHAKDGRYPTSGYRLGEETPIGQGKVNFPALVNGLKALGYEGDLTIEREIEGEEQIRDIRAGKEMLDALIAGKD